MRLTVCCVAVLAVVCMTAGKAADPGMRPASLQSPHPGEYRLGIGTVKLEQHKVLSVYRALNVLTLNGRPLLLQEMHLAGGNFTPFLKEVADYLRPEQVAPGGFDAWTYRLELGTYQQILLNKVMLEGKAVEGPNISMSNMLEPDFVEKYFEFDDRRKKAFESGRINFGKSAAKGSNEFQRERNWQAAADEIQASVKSGQARKTMTVTLLKMWNMREYDMKSGSFTFRSIQDSSSINSGGPDTPQEIRWSNAQVIIRLDKRWLDELRCSPEAAEKLVESIAPLGGDKKGPGLKRPLLLATDLELTYAGGGVWSARQVNSHVYRDSDFTQEITECKLGTRDPGT